MALGRLELCQCAPCSATRAKTHTLQPGQEKPEERMQTALELWICFSGVDSVFYNLLSNLCIITIILLHDPIMTQPITTYTLK